MPNMILILSFGAALLIIIAIVSFVIGGVAARNKASKTVGDAKSQVQKIIAEGEKQAEAKRREIMIEAKEEIHKSKVALEKDLKERRSEILQMEKRILQKEENLERKLE
ncbi:MAG TPA: Rnase Y domain-containing protein, partial [Clostridia bacterium]|nr:Rnase Y domain-containing protein [Clostridia bacterium]